MSRRSTPIPHHERPTWAQVTREVSYCPDSGRFMRKPDGHTRPSVNTRFGGKSTGSVNVDGYVYIRIAGRRFLAHQLAWFIVHGEWVDQLDHADGNPGHNAIGNLRPATYSQQQQNARKPVRLTASSRYLGVSRSGRQFRARIHIDGVTFELGRFHTEEAAHQAYLDRKAELHTFQPVPRPDAAVLAPDAIAAAQIAGVANV